VRNCGNIRFAAPIAQHQIGIHNAPNAIFMNISKYTCTSIVFYGKITGTGLRNEGAFTNDGILVLREVAGAGVGIDNSAGTLVNNGTIYFESEVSTGVRSAAGVLRNTGTFMFIGNVTGVGIDNAGGTVMNSGLLMFYARTPGAASFIINSGIVGVHSALTNSGTIAFSGDQAAAPGRPCIDNGAGLGSGTSTLTNSGRILFWGINGSGDYPIEGEGCGISNYGGRVDGGGCICGAAPDKLICSGDQGIITNTNLHRSCHVSGCWL
jgi:hypothetical protein